MALSSLLSIFTLPPYSHWFLDYWFLLGSSTALDKYIRHKIVRVGFIKHNSSYTIFLLHILWCFSWEKSTNFNISYTVPHDRISAYLSTLTWNSLVTLTSSNFSKPPSSSLLQAWKHILFPLHILAQKFFSLFLCSLQIVQKKQCKSVVVDSTEWLFQLLILSPF